MSGSSGSCTGTAPMEFSGSALFDNLTKILGDGSALCDQNFFGVNKALLAAACADVVAESGDFDTIEPVLHKAPADTVTAFIQLLHGQPVVFEQVTDFFALFSLVESLKAGVCQELCRHVVAVNQPLAPPLRLQLSQTEFWALRVQLRKWYKSADPGFCDASFRLRLEGGDRWERLYVHRVLFVSSCDFFKSMWASQVQDTDDEPEVVLEDPADAGAAKLMIRMIYGEQLTNLSVDELLRLGLLADRWQCELVLANVLQHLKQALDFDDAVRMLEQTSPMPACLFAVLRQVVLSHLKTIDAIDDNVPRLGLAASASMLGSEPRDECISRALKIRILKCCTLEGQQRMSLLSPGVFASALALFDMDDEDIPLSLKTIPPTDFSAAILEWSSSAFFADRCNEDPAVAAILRAVPDLSHAFKHLLLLQVHSGVRMGSRLARIFTDATEKLMSSDRPCSALGLFNELCANEFRGFELVLSASALWAAKCVDTLVGSPCWKRLHPSAMQMLLESPGLTIGESVALSDHVASWAKASSSTGAEAVFRIARFQSQHRPASSVHDHLAGALAQCVSYVGQTDPKSMCELCGTLCRSAASGGSPSPAKRRRVTQRSEDLDEASLGCLHTALLEWSTVTGHLEELSRSEAWPTLPAAALVRLTAAAGAELAAAAIPRWACRAEAPALFEALALSREVVVVFGILSGLLQERLQHVERMNATIQGGKVQDELAAAVNAATMRLQEEHAVTKTSLEEKLSGVNAQLQESNNLAESYRKKFQDLRGRLYNIYEDSAPVQGGC